jgi:hypothetical protein
MGGSLAPLCDGDAVDLDGGERIYDLETRSRDAGNVGPREAVAFIQAIRALTAGRRRLRSGLCFSLAVISVP